MEYMYFYRNNLFSKDDRIMFSLKVKGTPREYDQERKTVKDLKQLKNKQKRVEDDSNGNTYL
uniref:Transposase n=1 Tax=Heterorhabditis bacteriophora TaxID=37862 RepID=A0A1I7WZY8_HETBA